MNDERHWWDEPAADRLEVVLLRYPAARLVSVATLVPALIWGLDDLLQPSRVVIRRSRDHEVLATYRHVMRSAGARHRDYVAERLASDTVREFCTEYRIKAEQLV